MLQANLKPWDEKHHQEKPFGTIGKYDYSVLEDRCFFGELIRNGIGYTRKDLRMARVIPARDGTTWMKALRVEKWFMLACRVLDVGDWAGIVTGISLVLVL